MSEDDEYRNLAVDLQFAISLPPNRHMNTVCRTYDKKTLLSPLQRKWVGDNRQVALQFLYELLRRSKEVLKDERFSEKEKGMIKDKLKFLDRSVKNLHDFYGEDNPDIRAKLITFLGELGVFLSTVSEEKH